MAKYTVQALVEVTVEAENEADAQTKAHTEITFGTDVQIIEWGYIGKESENG